MKKLLISLMVMIFVVTNITSVFATGITADRFILTNDNGIEIDVLPGSGNVNAAVTVENSGAATGVMLISASYDADDKVIDVQTNKVNAGSASVYLDTVTPVTGAKKVRHFVWTEGKLTPVTDAKEISDVAPPAIVEEFAIYVNGTKLSSFDANTTTYAYSIDGKNTMPVVTVTGDDDAVITDPTSFPGSSTVVANGKTYTINYECSESVVSDFTILIADDNRTSSGEDRNDESGTPSKDNSELGGALAVGKPIYEFSDVYVYTSEITEVNSDFAGCEYIKMDSSFNHMHIGALHGAEDGDWVSFKAERPIRVYLAEAHEIGVNGDWNLKRPIKGTWLTNDGWTVADTSATGVIFKGISYAPGLGASYPVTYGANRTIYKDFEAGATVTLKTQGDAGTPYVPVIQAKYESPVTITVDGQRLPNFSETVYDYTYTINVATQINMPKVVVNDAANREVTVTNPTSFPGSSVVTIGGKTYTINYECSESVVSDFTILIANDDRKNLTDGGDRNDTSGTPSKDNSELGGALAVGKSIYEFSDVYVYTSEITEVNSEFAGSEYIKLDSSFNHMHTGALHNAVDGDWVSFKVNRPVRVYLAEAHEIGVNGDWSNKTPISGTWLAKDGWTVTDESTTGAILKGISYAPGLGVNYPVTYGANRTVYKDFAAGETVTLKTKGNAGTPYVPVIQAKYNDLDKVLVTIDASNGIDSANASKYFIEEYSANNKLYSDRDYTWSDMWDYLELEDSYVVKAPVDARYTDGYMSTEKKEWYSLTLSETADIIIFKASGQDNPFDYADYSVVKKGGNGLYFTTIDALNVYNQMMVKRVEVPAGETVTVKLYNLDANSSVSEYNEIVYVTFIKPVK